MGEKDECPLFFSFSFRKCDPKLKDKFAALYHAKEGKDPPPTEDEK